MKASKYNVEPEYAPDPEAVAFNQEMEPYFKQIRDIMKGCPHSWAISIDRGDVHAQYVVRVTPFSYRRVSNE